MDLSGRYFSSGHDPSLHQKAEGNGDKQQQNHGHTGMGDGGVPVNHTVYNGRESRNCQQQRQIAENDEQTRFCIDCNDIPLIIKMKKFHRIRLAAQITGYIKNIHVPFHADIGVGDVIVH